MTFTNSMMRTLAASRIGPVVKQQLRLLDDWLAAVYRSVVPRRRRAVLFEVHNTFGFDAQEPVIHMLAERGLVDVHVSGAVERGLPEGRIAALLHAGIHLHPLRGIRHRRFDAVVVTDARLVNSWRSSRYVYLHHGSVFGNLPFPYAYEMLECGDVDYHLALNPAEARDARAHFGERLRGRMRVVGQPKLDRLVNTTPRQRALLESLGLDPARRTILFLSHWTPTSLMHTWGEEILRRLRVRTEFNVLVTGHHNLWNHPVQSGGIDWRMRLGWIANQRHMRLLPQPDDLIALMTASDLAITDHTSATAEYALLYRPIVLFRNPAFVFSDQEYDALLRRTTSVFSHASEFEAAFGQALKLEPGDPVRRRELLDYCFCHLGDSSRQAAIAIEQVAKSGILLEDSGAVEGHEGPASAGRR